MIEEQIPNEPKMTDAEVTFNQHDMELLTISCRDEGAGRFYVIKTTEWSFNRPEEFMELLKKIENLFPEGES